MGWGEPSLLALRAASPACVSEQEAGRLVPKGRDCGLNARAGCCHQQPQDAITQAARDTQSRIRISRLWPCLISLIKPKVAARHFGLKKKKIKAHPASSRRAGQRSNLGLPEKPSSFLALHTGDTQ